MGVASHPYITDRRSEYGRNATTGWTIDRNRQTRDAPEKTGEKEKRKDDHAAGREELA